MYKNYYNKPKAPLTDTQTFATPEELAPLNYSPEQACKLKIVNSSYVEYRASIERAQAKQKGA